MQMAIATLYNVTVYNQEKEPKVERMQFYACDINGAVIQGEEHGKVVKATEAAWDHYEGHLF